VGRIGAPAHSGFTKAKAYRTTASYSAVFHGRCLHPGSTKVSLTKGWEKNFMSNENERFRDIAITFKRRSKLLAECSLALIVVDLSQLKSTGRLYADGEGGKTSQGEKMGGSNDWHLSTKKTFTNCGNICHNKSEPGERIGSGQISSFYLFFFFFFFFLFGYVGESFSSDESQSFETRIPQRRRYLIHIASMSTHNRPGDSLLDSKRNEKPGAAESRNKPAVQRQYRNSYFC